MPCLGIDEKAFKKGQSTMAMLFDLDNSTVEAISEGNSTELGVACLSQLSRNRQSMVQEGTASRALGSPNRRRSNGLFQSLAPTRDSYKTQADEESSSDYQRETAKCCQLLHPSNHRCGGRRDQQKNNGYQTQSWRMQKP